MDGNAKTLELLEMTPVRFDILDRFCARSTRGEDLKCTVQFEGKCTR